MNEKQVKFLELAKFLEDLDTKRKETEAQLEVLMKELGEGSIFQDPETKVVYMVTKPRGTFVPYKDVDYVRTALEGERAGTLSKKAAAEKGFDV